MLEVLKINNVEISQMIDKFTEEDLYNIDVLKKNHKLWLSSSIVLDLYLNRYSDAISKVIINDFENETKFFVETKAPGETLRKLQEHIRKQILKHGGIDLVIDTKEKVDVLFDILSNNSDNQNEVIKCIIQTFSGE